MRTTLAIDDDLLAVAKELAVMENRSVGEVISTLARAGLRPAKPRKKTRNGVPLLPKMLGTSQVSSELGQRLREELG